MIDIKNKVAFITGGSKGIGFGVAKILMAEDMKVVITSRSQKGAEEAAAELNTSEVGEAFGVASDVKSLDSQKQAVQKAIDKYGQIDLLLANAGVGHFASIEDLTEEQWNFWTQNGYVVIKNAISKEQAEQTAAFLWDFEEKNPKDPSTWYSAPRAEIQMKELAGTGMVEVYNNQHLWNNRQSQKVYDAFVDVWGTEKLWVTIDRANLNFPIKKGI